MFYDNKKLLDSGSRVFWLVMSYVQTNMYSYNFKQAYQEMRYSTYGKFPVVASNKICVNKFDLLLELDIKRILTSNWRLNKDIWIRYTGAKFFENSYTIVLIFWFKDCLRKRTAVIYCNTFSNPSDRSTPKMYQSSHWQICFHREMEAFPRTGSSKYAQTKPDAFITVKYR